MNIVITAGGTSEYIDTVRKITNSSTGKLGSIIAEKTYKGNHIFYIHTPKAIIPNVPNENIEFIIIKDTIELKSAVEKVLTENKIDWFIHSMAVSDYIVDYVSTADMLSDYLQNNGVSAINIINNQNVLDRTDKISSYEESLVLVLKKAPKIINIIKNLSPKTHLIGFKLLTEVSDDELISVAKHLMEVNKCDYVVANDLSKISNNKHKAFIIGATNTLLNAYTKEEIALIINNIINT